MFLGENISRQEGRQEDALEFFGINMFLGENISRQEGRQEDALEFSVLNLIVDHFESLVENFLFGELSVIQGGNNVDQEQVSNLVGHHLSHREGLDNDLAVLGVQDGEEGTSYGETVS